MTRLAQLARVLPPLIAAAVAVDAASRLGPPTRYMQEHGHRSAVVEVLETLEGGRVHLRVLEPLSGESGAELIVRGVGGALEPGERRIVGFTDRPSRRTPRLLVDRAEPRLLDVPAVGPALFEDSGAMRTLLRARPPG